MRATQVTVGVATVTGALVRFAPSAEAISSCIPGTSHKYSCSQACIGKCSAYYSFCYFYIFGYTGTKLPFLCNCLQYCVYARAVCTCKLTDGYGHGTCCCAYC